ncbi:OmpA family protein [Aristophania vespae]|uniref:OmpA family protein n=1 Tax=Aristophania vespae TaxID=2697033 RepID=A0A6P1NFV9_9PROT|nr:OmpA family protein [Aristophania vespae]QHI95797.1 OmpA family protein [Aristophania vespae]
MAQISTNFDVLPKGDKNSAPQAEKKTKSVARSSPSSKAIQQAKTGSPSSAAHTTLPAIPQEPPKPVIIPPPFVPVPTHPAVAPTDIKADQAAKSQFVSLAGTKRVLFDTLSYSLNQETIDAVSNLGKELASQPHKRIVLESYANIPGDDPSQPRRVALARALAIRSLLIRSGVATTRIYPIAHGRTEAQDKEPADRVDIRLEENPVKYVPLSIAAPENTDPALTDPQKRSSVQ